MYYWAPQVIFPLLVKSETFLTENYTCGLEQRELWGFQCSVALVYFLSSNFCFCQENLKLKALSGLSRGSSWTLCGPRKDFVIFRSWTLGPVIFMSTDLGVFTF